VCARVYTHRAVVDRLDGKEKGYSTRLRRPTVRVDIDRTGPRRSTTRLAVRTGFLRRMSFHVAAPLEA